MKFPLSRAVILFATLIVSLLIGTLSHAKSTGSLIVWAKGDYWRWDGGYNFTPLTKNGRNLEPILAPDGSRFAYGTYPKFYTDVFTVSGFNGLASASDISIYNLDIDSSIPVTAQPKDAMLVNKAQPYKFIARSKPAWSTDSKQIAWLEFLDTNEGPKNQSLVIYDLATKKTSILAANVPLYADLALPGVIAWGPDYIAVTGYRDIDVNTLVVYDFHGKQINKIILDTALFDVQQLWWATKAGEPVIVAYFQADGGTPFKLINPISGEIVDIPIGSRLVSTAASKACAFEIVTNERVILRTPCNPAATIFGNTIIALSPDGTRGAIAVSGKGDFQVFHKGRTDEVHFGGYEPSIEGILWGPLQWIIK